MKFIWDATKDQTNVAKHGESFESVSLFDWSSATIVRDERRDYGELRFRAMGVIDDRLYVIIFTPRDLMLRLISFRKANERERRRYERERADRRRG